MGRIITRLIVLGAAFCIGQAAWAADRLYFWTSGGDHGIDSCVFITMPSGEDVTGFGRLMFGVWADPATLELVGKVRLRLGDLPPRPRPMELGAGRETLLSVTLRPADADTATATVPVGVMKDLLGSLVHRPALWMRIGDGDQKTVGVAGGERDVSSCIAVLERDLAQERSARSRGEFSDAFPILQNDK
jgi:hypothetical protein